MGCANGCIAINLVNDLLQASAAHQTPLPCVCKLPSSPSPSATLALTPTNTQAHPNANCILVTTETTTPAFYPGHDKSRMVSARGREALAD